MLFLLLLFAFPDNFESLLHVTVLPVNPVALFTHQIQDLLLHSGNLLLTADHQCYKTFTLLYVGKDGAKNNLTEITAYGNSSNSNLIPGIIAKSFKTEFSELMGTCFHANTGR